MGSSSGQSISMSIGEISNDKIDSVVGSHCDVEDIDIPTRGFIDDEAKESEGNKVCI